MSTQSAPSIFFTHTTPQQGFRLLELPPELVELLSSENAPILELKSSPAPSSQTTSSTSAEYVNLCTPTKTYRIRQVQSSNSLHIIQPSDGHITQQQGRVLLSMVGGGGGNDQDGLDLSETVTAIAKCGSTLELHTPDDGFSGVPFLVDMLSVYGLEDNNTRNGSSGSRSRTIRQDPTTMMTMETDDEEDEVVAEKRKKQVVREVFADIPVSEGQCEKAWVEICAFLLKSDSYGDGGEGVLSSCRRPSPGMRLQVWKRLLEGAVLQGIDLGKQFLVKDLWKSVVDDEDEVEAPFPRPLFEAIVRRVCESADALPGHLFAEARMKWASIDRSRCIKWVGETYLEAIAPNTGSAINQAEFLSAWKDHLPDPWRDDVSLSNLAEACYMQPEPKTICFTSETDHQNAKKNLPADASAAMAAKKTRNWHELFKNQKRQKR